jgi:hypothetical protein
MKNQKYYYVGLMVLFVLIVFSIIFFNKPQSATERSTTLIFKLSDNYEENYLGPISYDEETDTYKSSYTIFLVSKDTELTLKDLEVGGVKRLQNNYYATVYVNSENMIQRFAVFDKSIDKESEGMRTPGDSIPLPKEEFYAYVIDENPLIEAYFCDQDDGLYLYPERNLDNLKAIVDALDNGEITKGCRKII